MSTMLKPRVSPRNKDGSSSPTNGERGTCKPESTTKIHGRKGSRSMTNTQLLCLAVIAIGMGLVAFTVLPSSEDVMMVSTDASSSNLAFTRPYGRSRSGDASVLQENGGEHVYDVLIVGAGWAGLSAASRLEEKYGITNFQILEGRDSIGGRSRTVYPFKPKDLAVELGSAWIYNETKPCDMMMDQDLPYGEIHFENHDSWGWYFANNNNNNVNKDKANMRGAVFPKQDKNSNDYYFKLMETFGSYSEKSAEQMEESGHDKPYQSILESYLQKNPDLSRADQQFLKTMVHTQIEIEFAAPSTEVSGAYVGDRLAGDCIFCQAYYYVPVEGGGFDKILRPLVEPVREKIQLNQKVTQVEYTTDSDDNKMAKVTYTDRQTGQQHVKLAKTVLMTVPLGVLKNKAIDFSPPLPPSKLHAIDVVGFGILNKVVFYWESDQSSWWPQGKEVLTYVTDNDNVGTYTTFFNEKELGNGDHFIMSAWTGGGPAVDLEKLTDQQIKNIVLENLRTMFGSNQAVPEPTSFVLSRWGQDEFAYGSYSFVTAGRKEAVDAARRELAAKTGNNLFWAGEATVKSWYGTTVGAYRSGKTAANDIHSALKQERKKKSRKSSTSNKSPWKKVSKKTN